MDVVSSFAGTQGEEDALKLPNLENIHSHEDVVIQLSQGWTLIYKSFKYNLLVMT